MNLAGKVALVTGGARRVGRAAALELASAGCDVAVTYRSSRTEAEQVVAAVHDRGRRGWALQADFAEPDEAAAQTLSGRLLETAGRVDVLVNNASVFEPTPWGAVSAQAWQRQMRVNALAPMLLTQALAGALAADEGGRVVNFVDIHVLGRPRRGYLAYNVSKAAMAELTTTLALEMAPAVTVNAIAPGVVAWPEGIGEGEKQAYLRRVPLDRAGTVADAARAVVFLVRDADYVTGQIIRVDGGRWLA